MDIFNTGGRLRSPIPRRFRCHGSPVCAFRCYQATARPSGPLGTSFCTFCEPFCACRKCVLLSPAGGPQVPRPGALCRAYDALRCTLYALHVYVSHTTLFAACSLLVALHCLRGLFGSAPPNGCTYSKARNDEQRCARTIDAACRHTTCNALCLASCISRSLRRPLLKACPAAPTSWRRSRATFNPCCRSKRRYIPYLPRGGRAGKSCQPWRCAPAPALTLGAGPPPPPEMCRHRRRRCSCEVHSLGWPMQRRDP